MIDITNQAAVIGQVQEFLREIANEAEGLPAVSVDGIYGAETAEAVRIFQRYVSLPQTGRVDPLTWRALADRALYEEGERDPLRYLYVPTLSPDLFPLEVGSRGYGVLLLHGALGELRGFYSTVPDVPPSSVYRAPTAAAVRALEQIYGRPVTGQVNESLWRQLFGDLASMQRAKEEVQGRGVPFPFEGGEGNGFER